METSHSAEEAIRFGMFEADFRSGELRKQGIKIKLQDQPFQVLQVLLQHPGEVVPREELRTRIWPSDTFVDFDVGINNAIKRLREALGDSADTSLHRDAVSAWLSLHRNNQCQSPKI